MEPFTDDEAVALRHRLLGLRGVVLLVGSADTGKTTFARQLLRDAVASGRTIGFVDADLARPTVGPPTCVGIKIVSEPSDLDELSVADGLRFVGSTSPQGVILPHVVAVATAVEAARRRADLVIVDTTSEITGVVGQTLKYHLVELTHPTAIVAIHRGGELEPIDGMLRRFLSVRIEELASDPSVAATSPLERQAELVEAFRAAFAPPLERWRVAPTVFAPTLPEGFPLDRLAGMLVGIQDANARCLGLGALEFADGESLRVITSVGEDMRGLRLGSMRIDLDTFATSRVRLRQLMFGI